MRALLILISLLSFGLVADDKPNDFTLFCNISDFKEAIHKYTKSDERFRSWVKVFSDYMPDYDSYELRIHTTKLGYVSEDKLIFSDPYAHRFDYHLDRKKLEMNRGDSCRLTTNEEADKYIQTWKQELKAWRLKYPKKEIKNKV
tara:strand:+ start:231 stop:662 length:432 start_codon:yes stop_codon:yes gene_type:complete